MTASASWILTSLTLLDGLPRELIVVGAGVVGLEYASFLAALGAEVTLIDQRPTLLDFVDREIMECARLPSAADGHHVPSG